MDHKTKVEEIVSGKANFLFLVLCGFFVVNAFIAEFVGVKIFSLERTLGLPESDWTLWGVDGLGLNLTAGVLLWPVVFVMTDVINEYFGPKAVRRLSHLTIGLLVYGFVMVRGTIALVPNSWWQSISGLEAGLEDMDLAFTKIFGQGLWIIIGSLVAFFVGQVLDVFVFHRIKRWTGERALWLRATGSTLVSQLVDSFVVLFIAFYIGADWDLVRVLAIGVVNYGYKVVVAVVLTPALYGVHFVLDRHLGSDLAEDLKRQAMHS